MVVVLNQEEKDLSYLWRSLSPKDARFLFCSNIALPVMEQGNYHEPLCCKGKKTLESKKVSVKIPAGVDQELGYVSLVKVK